MLFLSSLKPFDKNADTEEMFKRDLVLMETTATRYTLDFNKSFSFGYKQHLGPLH